MMGQGAEGESVDVGYDMTETMTPFVHDIRELYNDPLHIYSTFLFST